MGGVFPPPKSVGLIHNNFTPTVKLFAFGCIVATPNTNRLPAVVVSLGGDLCGCAASSLTHNACGPLYIRSQAQLFAAQCRGTVTVWLDFLHSFLVIVLVVPVDVGSRRSNVCSRAAGAVGAALHDGYLVLVGGCWCACHRLVLAASQRQQCGSARSTTVVPHCSYARFAVGQVCTPVVGYIHC